MKQTQVSIIVPAYNARDYLGEALDSALAQTYPRKEIIVVDDGSTDGTREMLEPYVKRNQIAYIYQKNKGLAGARNTGIRNARGEYVAFLDSDDLFLPEKIKAQVRVLEEHPDYGVCYTDLLHFTDTKPRTFYHHRYRYPSGDIFVELLTRQFLNPLTVMVRRSVYRAHGIFDESLRRSEDWDLWLRWARAGVKFYYLDQVLAHYRIRSVGNLSSLESEPEMKEKNLELFSRLGAAMTPDERERYKFSDVIRRLKLKTVFAYLLVGRKRDALTLGQVLPRTWQFLIVMIPAPLWRMILAFLRSVKRRLLLERHLRVLL